MLHYCFCFVLYHVLLTFSASEISNILKIGFWFKEKEISEKKLQDEAEKKKELAERKKFEEEERRKKAEAERIKTEKEAQEKARIDAEAVAAKEKAKRDAAASAANAKQQDVSKGKSDL